MHLVCIAVYISSLLRRYIVYVTDFITLFSQVFCKEQDKQLNGFIKKKKKIPNLYVLIVPVVPTAECSGLCLAVECTKVICLA